ncbi:regulatory signaling modulator protein AmpE [Escherichia coli]
MHCCGLTFVFDLAPLFWLIVGNPGPVTLMGYAFLRAWQYWLARYRDAASSFTVRR